MKLPRGYGGVTKLSGKRRRPYVVKKTVGWEIDEKSGKSKQKQIIIGYATTRKEGLEMLANYNNNPYDVSSSKLTFQEVFEKWSAQQYPKTSQASITAHNLGYKCCTALYNKPFHEIRLADLQYVIDTCGKNYPTLKKIKTFIGLLYAFAMKNDICEKDYSKYIDIAQYKDRNPNKHDKENFTEEEIEKVWTLSEDKYAATILMLIYTGLRVSELLNLKKEDVHLDEQYFDVTASKTENGIRKVPIADKILPFFRIWYKDGDSEYLIHQENGKAFSYDSYLHTYYRGTLQNIGIDHNPHCCRHTCISMMAKAEVSQTIIKKIVGHAGAMSLTERVYTHFDVKELLDAINKIGCIISVGVDRK